MICVTSVSMVGCHRCLEIIDRSGLAIGCWPSRCCLHITMIAIRPGNQADLNIQYRSKTNQNGWVFCAKMLGYVVILEATASILGNFIPISLTHCWFYGRKWAQYYTILVLPVQPSNINKRADENKISGSTWSLSNKFSLDNPQPMKCDNF